MSICTFRFGDGGAERVLRVCRAGGAGQVWLLDYVTVRYPG
jgi:hypothetical protein